MAHKFLSEDWFQAVEALRSIAPETPQEARHLRVDLVITQSSGPDIHAHLDHGHVDRGLSQAQTVVKIPYEVAKRLLVEGDPSKAMEAFLAGHITIEGDAAALMQLQSLATAITHEQLQFQRKLQKLTA